MMTKAEQKQAARKFADFWRGKGYEKGQSQAFWLSLLRDVYGQEHPEEIIHFESKVKLSHDSFIDGHIQPTHVLIEQKSLGKSLEAPIRQSDGTMLTPYQQAKRYAAELPYSQRPRWIVTSNFEKFYIYDMERPGGDPEIILLRDLPTEYYRLSFLVDSGSITIQKETQVSVQAGELVGLIYDKLLAQYRDPDAAETLRSLNVLCVRLVFCLYAEDAGLFGPKSAFYDYLTRRRASARSALIALFRVLDTPIADRDPYLDEDLAAFPYVNGGLFQNEDVEIPRLTPELLDLILISASRDFDWSEISPTIFGAVFESTLNPETRRKGGMHYTSIENIHKLVDPLFLDELREELDEIMRIPVQRTRLKALTAYQDKLAGLRFLDPACGSGNFLTETYTCLRRLENDVIRARIEAERGQIGGQMSFGFEEAEGSPIKVSIGQFAGIEINDFATVVARTALWIAEAQTMQETEAIVHMQLDLLPLKTSAKIIEGNALRIDWAEAVGDVDYIIGNPPFSGARLMTQAQKADMAYVFDGLKNTGNLDYCSAWYWKAAQYMRENGARTALVSTNSISQGEQPAILWKPIMESGIVINFAHKTFVWSSEASIKAHVHCVIIGFSRDAAGNKWLYSGGRPARAEHINAYLSDAPDVFIEPRKMPLCDVPKIGIGNMPVDDGQYLFDKEEMEAFILKEPGASKYFRPWYGSREFIRQEPRYCLWLGGCSPAELNKLPACKARIEAVRKFRASSKRAATAKLADRPTRFMTEAFPATTYVVIPKVSSERRRYIPMGFFTPDIMCSDLVFIVPNAGLYHFGVLTSNVHMAWMRTVCGRLKSDYRYSKDIVYNNFPWPDPTAAQRQQIEQTAQAILDARDLYPDSSLASLYDPLTMPPELLTAHQRNDAAVMKLYGFRRAGDDGKQHYYTEEETVAALFRLYKDMA